MLYKRIFAGVLSGFLLISMGFSGINPAYAAQLETMQTIPQETVIQETQPDDALSTSVTTPEPTGTYETEPEGSKTPTSETEAVVPETIIPPTELPPETELQPTEPPGTDPQETVPPATEPEVTMPLETVPSETKPVMLMLKNSLAADGTEMISDAGSLEDDLPTVSGQGITFRLFNYSTAINKSSGGTAWRPISSYFTFRNSAMTSGTDAAAHPVPSPTTNSAHDQDGFTKAHATVERVLDQGYPVLDLTRNADGSSRTNPGVEKSTRSLRYLFTSGDHAVTAYSPRNTVLQRSGSHYWYDSAEHAVDYDIASGVFRLRSYPERNSTTAGYGEAYGDFLPFTYTGGVVKNTTADEVSYHVESQNTDYWFGMEMQVNFFQTKSGKLGQENMVFRFSGDDDVWVFVDDVLVLDLGGTHGTVNGSIDFSTGEILQYLTWGGANGTEAERKNGSSTSFPTSLRACFDEAGRTPKGGWSTDGRTFADYSEHTLKFFYLERGSAVANCSLDFRLPTLPDESLTVTKDLSAGTDTQIRDYIADSVDYRFRVMKADEAGNATDEPFITAGMTYELLENGVKTGVRTVGEDHCFLLKAGQSAQFMQMLHKGAGATRYVVEEIMPDSVTGQYAGVAYLLSGAGGETVTNNKPADAFTAFQTPVLSADQTQAVTFRNRVDTSKLGTLKITKVAAPGTQIPADLSFRMQVKLGGIPIPVGTGYMVGEERRTVDTAGILLLRVGETAEIEQGILADTEYQITELSSSVDGYRAAYTGSVAPAGEINCTQDGASGDFPLGGTVHITVSNADYDFAVQIPVSKKVLDFQEESDFRFLIEQVVKVDGEWQTVDTLPACVITVPGDQTEEERITIGYRSDSEGVFCYRITEESGSGNYIYDPSVFLVEVTVSDGVAEITGIQKNGTPADSVLFVNRAVTKLTVTKHITGGSTSMQFPFTVEVYLDGEPFSLPEAAENSGYTTSGNMISFSLGHDESVTLPHIPINAVAVVKEHDYDGFLVFNRLEGMEEQQTSGAVREVCFTDTAQTLHFTNQTGYRLPNTGGAGTFMYRAGGAVLSLGMGAALRRKRSHRERQKKGASDA